MLAVAETGSAPSELTHSLIDSIDSAHDHVRLGEVEERARVAQAARETLVAEATARVQGECACWCSSTGRGWCLP